MNLSIYLFKTTSSEEVFTAQLGVEVFLHEYSVLQLVKSVKKELKERDLEGRDIDLEDIVEDFSVRKGNCSFKRNFTPLEKEGFARFFNNIKL